MRPQFSWCAVLLVVGMTVPVHAREWRDSTGKFSVQAELIASTEDQVVLKREDGRLVALSISQLSAADQEYLKSQEATQLGGAGDLQTWTLKDDWKVNGRVVAYGRKNVVIQRRRGRVYVNDRVFGNLPPIYQRMVPEIVSHFEGVELNDANAFNAWVLRQRGQARTFEVDGVMLELENGDEYAVPFIFFSSDDKKVLQPGWERWLAAHQDEVRRQQEDFFLQAQAEAYFHDRRVNQQIAAMQLTLMAVNAGVVDLWEVYLEPPLGVALPPQFVVVPARNSQQAIEMALSKNPNFFVGSARRLN